MVEFALVLPALMMLFLGLFEVGRLMAVWIAMQQGAQEAARVGSIISSGETQTSLEAAVVNQAKSQTALIGGGLTNCSGNAITSSQCTTSLANGGVAVQCQSDPTDTSTLGRCVPYDGTNADDAGVHVSNGYVRVEITYPYAPMPLVYPFGTIRLRSWAQVRVE